MAKAPGQVWPGDTKTMTMETSKGMTGETGGTAPGDLKLVASNEQPKHAAGPAKRGTPPAATEAPSFGSVDIEAFSRNLERCHPKRSGGIP